MTDTQRGYWIWETEDFDATEEEAQRVAAFVLNETIRVLAYPIYGVTRLEHELQDGLRAGGATLGMLDEFRASIEDAATRVALEVAPLLASRQESILLSLRQRDPWAITALFGEALALALAGVDRWYPEPKRGTPTLARRQDAPPAA